MPSSSSTAAARRLGTRSTRRWPSMVHDGRRRPWRRWSRRAPWRPERRASERAALASSARSRKATTDDIASPRRERPIILNILVHHGGETTTATSTSAAVWLQRREISKASAVPKKTRGAIAARRADRRVDAKRRRKTRSRWRANGDNGARQLGAAGGTGAWTGGRAERALDRCASTAREGDDDARVARGRFKRVLERWSTNVALPADFFHLSFLGLFHLRDSEISHG